MSEVWLHGIERWGKGVCPVLESYTNPYGGAMVVWEFMALRFGGAESYYDLNNTELFRLAYQKAIPEHFRRVMLLTYDRAVLLSDHVDQAVKDIELFLGEFSFPSNTINHWPQIAEDLKNHGKKKKHVGFGFCMHTIGDTLFEGEAYKKRHMYKHKRIAWKQEGFFSIYDHKIDRY